MTKNEIFTIEAYGLQHFHKMGHQYNGTSNIYISLTYLEKGYYKAEIKKNIVQIELKHNFMCILTGEGSIYFYILPTKP